MRPFDLGDALDYHTFGTMRSPGVCRIIGADRQLNWDIKEAKGQEGASSTLNGKPLGEFEVEYYLADDGAVSGGQTDFDLWETFQRLVESTVNGPKPVALPFYHPDTARNHYTEVVLRNMGNMIHDGRGGATIKVKYGEHKPPKPKKPAKAAGKPYAQTEGDIGTGRRVTEDPNAAAKAQLESLRGEYART